MSSGVCRGRANQKVECTFSSRGSRLQHAKTWHVTLEHKVSSNGWTQRFETNLASLSIRLETIPPVSENSDADLVHSSRGRRVDVRVRKAWSADERIQSSGARDSLSSRFRPNTQQRAERVSAPAVDRASASRIRRAVAVYAFRSWKDPVGPPSGDCGLTQTLKVHRTMQILGQLHERRERPDRECSREVSLTR